MRRLVVDHEGFEYGVVMRDDHPAQVYHVKTIGCRELWGDYVTSIYPFVSEAQPVSIIADTVRKHLDLLESENGPAD